MLQKERRKQLFNTFHIVSRGNDIFVLNPYENETTVSFYNTSYNSRDVESHVKVLKCSASANVPPVHTPIYLVLYYQEYILQFPSQENHRPQDSAWMGHQIGRIVSTRERVNHVAWVSVIWYMFVCAVRGHDYPPWYVNVPDIKKCRKKEQK